MREFIESPFSNGVKRIGSSPPSPLLLLPPIRFMAIANVVCASHEIEPNDIAPEAKRLKIFSTGSTSLMSIAGRSLFKSNKPRKVNASFA